MKLKESTVLLDVRRIKEEMAQAADADPGFYQSLNGLGAKLLARYRKSPPKPRLKNSPSARKRGASSSTISKKSSP